MKWFPEKGFSCSFNQLTSVEYKPPKIYYKQTYLFLIVDSILRCVEPMQNIQKVIRFLHTEKWNHSTNSTLKVINNV
jgi:hypothetical protein